MESFTTQFTPAYSPRRMSFRVGFYRERLPSRDSLTTQIARSTRDAVVDLEVDTETGQVEVLKSASAYDVDDAINDAIGELRMGDGEG